jgi:teichuronic acid biosynthesis glycosyltransferase TuaG
MSVSVIIPTWNRAHTLGKAIESALAQTVPVLEILVCDDGSTDDSFRLVKGFKKSKVIWVDGLHTGLPAVARNRGLEVAKGEWVAFLDSDDEWLPTKLQKQMDCLRKSGTKAVCSNAIRIIPDHFDTKSPSYFFPEAVNKSLNFDDLLQTNSVICSSALLHHSLLAVTGPFPDNPKLRALEDYALWLRVSCLTSISFLAEPLVSYYDNPGESVRKEDVVPIQQRLRVLRDLNQWATQHRQQVAPVNRLKIKRELKKIQGAANPSTWLATKRLIRSLLDLL